MSVGMTTVLIWDWIDNLRSDFKLLFFFKLGLPTFLHFGSRVSLLVYALSRAVLLSNFTGCFLCVRVFAIYNRERFIGVFFGIHLLAAIGISSTFYLVVGAENVGPTKYCMETLQDLHYFLPATYTVFLVDETLIYFAIVWRIYLMFLEHTGTSLGQTFKILVWGASLPVLSRIVLPDSQMHFIIIVISKAILVFIIVFCKQLYQAMFIICHLVLVNVMTSRVYRNLKLGLDDEQEVQSLIINLTREAEQ
ncbi:hypothetical protein CPB84DRAFT_277606 [Gymnopilus junonius]|uniref:Uncharacterized protein n=1 Tax=Gymnopilus junonius TaxID=109634 RepID=A0A9P5NDG3_GYMJU|nr:hypothetical protein CPB84DRAFT_277606 [Gymnopilus junonius]